MPERHSTVVLIAALDRNWAIGKENQIPWRLKSDMAFFKQMTLRRSVVMGRKTAESIGRALPGRTNIVVTSKDKAPYPDQVVARSVKEAIQMCKGPVSIIGGARVYEEALPYANMLMLTHVDTEVKGADTYFPQVNLRDEWRILSLDPFPASEVDEYSFRIVTYERR